MKKLLLKSVLGVFLLGLLVPSAWAMDSGIEIDTTDTVAGYGALVRISNAPVESDLEVLLTKPDGSQVLLETESDKYGKTKIDIEGFYTKKAGDYSIQARSITRNESFGSSEPFYVYADTVSSSRSLLEMSQQTAAANGNEYVQIKINLYDQYRNPIQGHTVDMLSSRLTDEIVRVSKSPYTNELGSIVFNAYSREAGVSTLIVHDSTEGVTLNERAEIAFYEPRTKNTQSEIGGNKNGFTSVLFANTGSGPVSYLEIEDLEETAILGETLNFTVTAYDEDGDTATDYTGEVRFSSTDNNATLPNDYLFEAEDQGTHTFSLSLSFVTEGTQTITVTDLDNTDIYGEFDIEITSEGTGSSTGTSGNTGSTGTGDFNITTPSAGSYSANKLTFTGNATYGLTIEVFDNDIFLGDTTADVTDTFSYEAQGLEDGSHRFILTAVDSDGSIQDTSDEIAITIDTTPPELDHATIEPEGDIEAGEEFIVTVYSEKDLPEVSVVFNNGIFDLTENLITDGVYEGAFTAPAAYGEYEIDIILVDELGNEISNNAALTLNIIEPLLPAADNDDDDATDNGDDDDDNGGIVAFDPGKITGIEAVASDSRVTLSWESPLDPTETEINIDHYKIYYGPTPDFMFYEIETLDNSTTWYVPDLENGSTYHFKITAIDAEGNESIECSDPVEATPMTTEEELLAAAALERAQEEAEAAAEQAALELAAVEEEIPTETGPEVAWLIAFSLLFTQAYIYLRREKNKVIVPIQDIRA